MALKHAITLFGLLSFCISALTFNVSVPSNDQPLALNSSSIEIDWTLPSNKTGNPNDYTQIDLQFGGNVASGSGFTYNLVMNYSISEMKYIWNPHNISQALQQNPNIQLTTASEYYIVAHAHNANSSFGPQVTSADYKVTGYPNMTSAATRCGPQAAALLVAGTVLVVLL